MEMESRLQSFPLKYNFITKGVWKQGEVSVKVHNHALAMPSIHSVYTERHKQGHAFSGVTRDNYRTKKQDFSPRKVSKLILLRTILLTNQCE